MDSVVASHRLSCSLAWGNLPRPGIESVSSALTGSFPPTVLPGKSPYYYYFDHPLEQGAIDIQSQLVLGYGAREGDGGG